MSPEWTNGRLKAFIVSTLRAGARKYPPKFETLKDAFVGKKTNIKTNRLAAHYKCNHCRGEFPAADVNVDHIDPVVDPAVGFVDWNTFISRLFCSKENLQVLCSDCHNKKSKLEREINASHKASNKRK